MRILTFPQTLLSLASLKKKKSCSAAAWLLKQITRNTFPRHLWLYLRHLLQVVSALFPFLLCVLFSPRLPRFSRVAHCGIQSSNLIRSNIQKLPYRAPGLAICFFSCLFGFSLSFFPFSPVFPFFFPHPPPGQCIPTYICTYWLTFMHRGVGTKQNYANFL